MKIINLIEELIIESNKTSILVDKLGLNQEVAKDFNRLCGPLSVWMANKFLEYVGEQNFEYMMAAIPKEEENEARTKWDTDIKYRMSWGRDRLKKFTYGLGEYVQLITEVMDWVRVGLNGNLGPWKDKRFGELYRESKNWHNSLDVGQGAINYNENNKVLRDYRKDGIGFYWVDLETNDSKEECDRMGHCGRTNDMNTIYSLRENKKYNQKYTINKSHLTAAVGKTDGIIYQLKGPKNSKPKEEFHPYVIDLITNFKTITGFGSEYSSESDFKISDLSEPEVKKLYGFRPELFNSRSSKRLLAKMGIADFEEPNMVFDLQIDANSVGNYVDGDWVTHQSKDKNGFTKKTYFIETLLSGDIWDFLDGYFDEWKGGLEYYTNKENTQKIIDIIKQRAGDDFDPEISLEDLISQYDDDYQIRNAIGSAYSDSANSSYYDYAIKQLKSALSEYGDVLKLNDAGATIRIDLQEVIDNQGTSDDDLDSYFENCGETNYHCIFDEIMGEYYEKPKFYIDERWYPDIDEEDFNSYLDDRLYEIR